MELEQQLDQFTARHSQLIALAYQNLTGAQETVTKTNVSYPVLADVGHQVAEAYGVFNLLGDGVATPAVFIIDPAGQIIWSYIGQDFADRPSTSTLLEQLPPY